MRSFKTGTLVVLTSLALAATAQAAPQKRYFDCGGDTPVTNISEPPLTWSATEPATAASAGGGCVSAVYEVATTQFGGMYAGEVKQLDLTVHGAFGNPAYRALLGVSLNIDVAVDGESLYTGEQVEMSTEAGAVPGGFKATVTIPDLNVPETTKAKQFTITISNPFVDDQYFLGRGASDWASGVTLYSTLDLPEPEPVEEEL